MYDVEGGVEIPKGRGAGRPPKYPFSKMEVGQSVLVTGSADERWDAIHAAHATYRNDRLSGRDPIRRFKTRTVGPDQTRIWRIE